MKRFILAVVLILGFASVGRAALEPDLENLPLSAHIFAQMITTHNVSMTWVDTLNPATGTTYSVYRATGLCSGTPTFAKIATALSEKTYADTTVTPGPYCFEVTATVNGVESAPSNTIQPNVPAFAPSGLAFTVQ